MHTSSQSSSGQSCSSCRDYRTRAEQEAPQWQEQIDTLKTRGNQLSGDARREFDAMMSEIEGNQSSFMDYLSGLADKAEDNWEELKDEAQRKWASMSDTLQKAISKYL